MTITGY